MRQDFVSDPGDEAVIRNCVLILFNHNLRKALMIFV